MMTEHMGTATQTEQKQGHDIMISYSWAQKDLVTKIYRKLTEAGFRIWRDEENIRGALNEAMADAIEKSKMVLICLSTDYEESRNCKKEAKFADKKEKSIIPLNVQSGYTPCRWLDFLLEDGLRYDFTNEEKFSEEMERLILGIKEEGINPRAEKPVQKVSLPYKQVPMHQESIPVLNVAAAKPLPQIKRKAEHPVQLVSPVKKQMMPEELGPSQKEAAAKPLHVLQSEQKGSTGKPAIAVFAGGVWDDETVHYNPMKRVIAAYLTPLGLQCDYTQVEAIPTVPHPRKSAAVVRYKGEVWLVGGLDKDDKPVSECDVLNLATWQWREGPSLGTPRYDHTTTELNGVLVTVGGCAGKNYCLSSVETRESGKDWQPGPELPGAIPGAMGQHAACEWNGRIWVSGGTDGRHELQSVMSWKPGERDWQQEEPLIDPRCGHTMVGTGWHSMLVCGGRGNVSMLEYSIESEAWSRVIDLPESENKVNSSLVVYDHTMYIVGGLESTSTLSYDNNWFVEASNLPWKMYDTVACLIDIP